MRLLKRSPDGEFKLVSFEEDNPPPYAILSHTWADSQEVSYHELVAGTGKNKTGYAKIRFCSGQAKVDGLEYFWVDTCCIDKSISSELSAAINSMFRWYQRASKCYVYLSDVSVPEEVNNAEDFPIVWMEAFRRCRSFTRGWTLQELLAPASVELFSREGKRLGSRITLEQEIHEVTKIPITVLRGQNFSHFSVEERMSWAAKRTTTLKEDKIYCLLGIFGVFLPLLYGEGEAYATSRLREEIQKRHGGRVPESSHDSSVSSLLPFPRNEHFTGREDELQSLQSKLLLPNTHRRITIHGLGGCGKSALAIEFAYRAMARNAGCLVFWVPAISTQSFELAYREIGVRLHIPGINEDNADIKKLVKEALSLDSAGHWLMIVDNADDPGFLAGGATSHPGSNRLRDYLPCSNRGKILFTTRSRKAAGDLSPSSVLELRDMSKAEAQQLLVRRILKPALLDDEKAVDKLLESLEFLPLAIVQASAFINNNDLSVSEYISLFQTGTEAELFGEHFEDLSRYPEMESTIARTWHISFDQIRRKDPLAAEYLSFIACIDRINIPRSLLPHGGSLLQQTRAIGTLKGYAFITERQRALQQLESERFFDMHRLVHLALIWWLEGHDERSPWTAKAVDRLEELITNGEHKKESWMKYLPHAIHVASSDGALNKTTKASLLEHIGLCQIRLGQYSAAETIYRQVLLLEESNVGGENASSLKSMSSLAIALERQGKYEEAEILSRQTLAQQEKVLMLEHPDTLTSMNNLGTVLGTILVRQGKFGEAESINRQTLAREEKLLGPEHPYTLISMANLAAVLGSQGRYEEAEILSRQALARQEKVLGLEHPDTLTSMSDLAFVLERRGNYEEAEILSRQTLARQEKVLGVEHPHTLIGISNLAGILERQGRYEEAEILNRQTIVQQEQVLGPENPSTLISMSNLAAVLDRQGKYEEAESLSRQTLAQRERVLGLEHPDTMTSMSNLAALLERQGEYKEAEMLGRQTLARREKVLGLEHPDTLFAVYSLARILATQCCYAETLSLYKRACTAYGTVLGDNHPTTRLCLEDYHKTLALQELD